MEKLTRLDKYIITPNVCFYGGFRWSGNDIFLCEDHDTDIDYDFKVKQEIKNGMLVTDLQREYSIKGKNIKENSHMEVELEKGQLLVYVEGIGYTMPEHKMCEVEDAIEQFKILRGDMNDTCGNEKESTVSD